VSFGYSLRHCCRWLQLDILPRLPNYMNDVLRPNGFENILKDDFVALCEMLR
jgi:hypothetical protein